MGKISLTRPITTLSRPAWHPCTTPPVWHGFRLRPLPLRTEYREMIVDLVDSCHNSGKHWSVNASFLVTTNTWAQKKKQLSSGQHPLGPVHNPIKARV